MEHEGTKAYILYCWLAAIRSHDFLWLVH